MTTPYTTTSDTDDSQKQDETGWREAVSMHAKAEKVLRVIFKVAGLGAQTPLRYYRAILYGPDGEFHLAGSHVCVEGGTYVKETAPDSEPPFWVERHCGLRDALQAVNNFVPKRRSGDVHIAVQFLKGRRKCHVLWRLMQAKSSNAMDPVSKECHRVLPPRLA